MQPLRREIVSNLKINSDRVFTRMGHMHNRMNRLISKQVKKYQLLAQCAQYDPTSVLLMVGACDRVRCCDAEFWVSSNQK